MRLVIGVKVVSQKPRKSKKKLTEYQLTEAAIAKVILEDGLKKAAIYANKNLDAIRKLPNNRRNMFRSQERAYVEFLKRHENEDDED